MKKIRLLILVVAALMLQTNAVVAEPLSIVAHQVLPGPTVGTMNIYIPDARDPRMGTYYTFGYASVADRVHFDHCVRVVLLAQTDPSRYSVDLRATPAPASRYVAGAVYDTGNPFLTGIYGGGCRLTNR
jgi:hypothetical protein